LLQRIILALAAGRRQFFEALLVFPAASHRAALMFSSLVPKSPPDRRPASHFVGKAATGGAPAVVMAITSPAGNREWLTN
jgi:hypothetical protein